MQLVRLLHESNRYRVRVACLSGEGVLRDDVLQLGLSDIREFPLTSFYDRNAFAQLRRFARFLREQEFDIVHTHDFYTNIFGMAAATLAGIPVRIASRRETNGMRTHTQKRVERAAYRAAHAIVANAEAVREQLIYEGVDGEKITIVYNGLDLTRITPKENLRRADTLAAFNLPRDETKRFVTIVANLRHEVKDHKLFLRAARLVHDAVPEAAFIIAGEGELMDSIKSFAAEQGLSCDTFFTGRCERVAELLAISDVCVLSSRAEGFSNSILEYMAASRAVVATNVGGAREAISEGETGYLVPAGDVEKMAARIISLLCDNERRHAMGERGREVVERKFSCAAQLERIETLYERLLARETQGVAAESLEPVPRQSS